MTPEEINAAIAKACGWNGIYLVGDTYFGLSPDEKNESYTEEIPDYYHSLDACAEFEQAMTWAELRSYDTWLYTTVEPNMELDNGVKITVTAFAAAPQRCEAFLRVRGLWRDGK